MDDEPAIESGVLSEVAHHVAQSEDFSKLKNKGQREAFVERLLQSKAYEAIPNYYAGEISQRAEGIYEFGVLPGRVKSLLNQGKSILEASKYLGISKQKAERAVAMQTPDFIAEMMKDEEQGSVGNSKF